jgi:hypothetical protein
MSGISNRLSGIEEKIRTLISRQSALQEQLKIKETELSELLQLNTRQKKIITELEEKLKLIKLSKTIENKDGAQAAKLKINELVREIDKCMGLLNS